MTYWSFVDGKLTLAKIDWRKLSPGRLLNVLYVMMQEHLVVSPETSNARTRLDDWLTSPARAGTTEDEDETMPRELGPLSELDEDGLPVGLREPPRGEVRMRSRS